MQEAIDNISGNIKCKKCLSINIEYGPHIFIDTTIFTDNKYTKHDNTHSRDYCHKHYIKKSNIYFSRRNKLYKLMR